MSPFDNHQHEEEYAISEAGSQEEDYTLYGSGSSEDDLEGYYKEYDPIWSASSLIRRSRSPSSQTSPISITTRDPLLAMCAVAGLLTSLILFRIYPFFTTIHLYIGFVVSLLLWTSGTWIGIIFLVLRSSSSSSITNKSLPTWSNKKRVFLAISTIFMIYWASAGLKQHREYLPVLSGYDGDRPAKYMIAANMYNNQDVLPTWTTQLLKLCEYLGEENTFISVYESNSVDHTKAILHDFRSTLTTRGIRHRIITESDDDRWWPYNTSPERIAYLAKARNRALEPLQSEDEEIRLSDYDTFTKVIFLNDVYFTYQGIARLIATRKEDEDEPVYDMACAMDFGSSGLYDTWVIRDSCGLPFRAFWPYARAKHEVDAIKHDKVFSVASCWNGAVVLPTAPLLRQIREHGEEPVRLAKRGWKSIDNSSYPSSSSRMSPALSLPLQFRESGIDACDHSECFLLNYDLHRLYNTTERPPRIYVNPTVKLAYDKNWFEWHNKVLTTPFVRLWLHGWARGIPFKTVDWFWEAISRRRRDHCTWSALNRPATCPALPGPADKSWSA